MTQTEGGMLVAMIGTFSVWMASSDVLTRYLRPQMKPWLLAAGVVLILVGVAAAIAGHRTGERTRLRIGWLLIAPLAIHALLNPGPLGSFAVAQQADPRFVTNRHFDLEAHLHAGSFGGQRPELRMTDFVVSSQSAHDRRLLERQPVRLTGFVGPDAVGPHQFTLTRFLVSCCAADAVALEVVVRGLRTAPPATDTWVRVVGTFDGLTRPMRGRDVELPSLRVERMERVHAPTDPYEFP